MEQQKLNQTQKYVLAEHSISFSLPHTHPWLSNPYIFRDIVDTWNWQYFLQIRDCLTTIQNCTQNYYCINSKVRKVQANVVLDVTMCSMAEIYTRLQGVTPQKAVAIIITAGVTSNLS
jgi:hypothetical protein